MNPTKPLLASLTAILLASCASKSDPYDTGNVYGYPDAGYANTDGADTAGSLYDTPAIYSDQDPAPDQTPAEPAAASSYYKTHTVGRGDTLSGISKKYNVPMNSIIKENNLKNPNLLVLGSKLIIPNR